MRLQRVDNRFSTALMSRFWRHEIHLACERDYSWVAPCLARFEISLGKIKYIISLFASLTGCWLKGFMPVRGIQKWAQRLG